MLSPVVGTSRPGRGVGWWWLRFLDWKTVLSLSPGGLGRRRQVADESFLRGSLQLPAGPEGGGPRGSEGRPPKVLRAGPPSNAIRRLPPDRGGPVVSPWTRRAPGSPNTEPVRSLVLTGHYGAHQWSRGPSILLTSGKDPDIFSRNTMISSFVAVFSYISSSVPFRGIFACPAVPSQSSV